MEKIAASNPLTRFFHPVIGSHKLQKKPALVEIWGEKIVVFRDANGKVGAISDRCPHRFMSLSKGWVDKRGLLVCPYHGWRFNAEGRGIVPSVSLERFTRATRCFQAIERLGYIWVADRNVPLSTFPDPEGDGYVVSGSFSVSVEAPLHVVMHNFSEDEHLPFVHKTFGLERK